MNNEEITEVSSEVSGKSAVEFVAEAIIADVELLKTIKKPQNSILHAALHKAIFNALSEVQSIAFLAKNKDDFYRVNQKYIMILGMYNEILQEKIKEFKKGQISNHLLIDQQVQLFVIMLSKLFQLIKRADIYFEDEKQYSQFKHLLPVQMYIDNVVIPNEQEKK
jgi:hypothetical protein